jgi:hypothetical protein
MVLTPKRHGRRLAAAPLKVVKTAFENEMERPIEK